MRRFLIPAAALLQVLVLAYVAAEREFVVRRGRTIHLRTVPVDPRDAFRGDYVRLNYEISDVPRTLARDGLAPTRPVPTDITRGTRVYAVLCEQPDGVSALEYLTDKRPAAELFVRGRVDWCSESAIHVRYGLEAFFAGSEQVQAVASLTRLREGFHVPLEMEVAVGRNGVAVLKGYRQGPLGIGLTVETNAQGRVCAAVVRLLNVSSNDLAIVDVPGGRSLELVPAEINQWQLASWTWVGHPAPEPALTDAMVRRIPPGRTHEMRVDFGEPAWFVVERDKAPHPITEWGPWESFRMVYRPPDIEACRGLRDAPLIWHGRLVSPRVRGGRLD